ncbi:galactokinase [Parasphaerochaeta coccoides]|uniref:Galactokinase n=1 Tax=Parasphaerochaeta coccoides (strain ATCC BAA-1237 / DSM 17374 / SPN1) TaxID=760011 RepID=F4GIF1_PARC1|nr:galactokinase family protein [Parasphaerochaeta coccoides]AEC01659.1 Galactokinase [Parasphaerochaeta coccoides DSM 17374]
MAILTPPDIDTLHAVYPQLYGSDYDATKMDERFHNLLDGFIRIFGKTERPALFSTPGRTELAGNHTDHNMGKVIAASINLDTIAAVIPTDDNTVQLISEGFRPVSVNLSDLAPKEEEKESSTALVRGIARSFSDEGIALRGWKAYTTSTVLKGSGLSSSAAIEILCATIFNHYSNNDAWSPIKLAQIGKYAENVYFNKPSGLMDQAACAHGGIIGMDFANPANVLVTPVSFDFFQAGYVLTIVDTGGNHADLTSDYASIPPEMGMISAFFNKKYLREVPQEEFYAALPALHKSVKNDRSLLRAIHFFDENNRVAAMLNALQNNDMTTYLSLTNEACHSAFEYLQNLYSPHNPLEQGLGLALALSRRILNGCGACRNHGGGFAGTILAYVPVDLFPHYKKEMELVFGKNSVTALAIRHRKSSRIL